MFKQKTFAIFVLASIVFTVPNFSQAQTVDPGQDPNKLIEDRVFSDTQTFGGATGIQKFLETKGSLLANTDPAFLAQLKEPTISILKQGLEDPQPNLTRLRTAAELIWDSAQSSGLNPQVILITLEKEQSLITGRKTADSATLQKALDRALGFGCPDSGGCENIFAGFYFQLFGNFDATASRYLGATKSLMKSFSTPGGRGPAINNGTPAKVGEAITLENTQGPPYNCDPHTNIIIANNATAALYRYTPHWCNGNKNFQKFFAQWFRYPNGTIIKLLGSGDSYIIQNGVKQLVPAFVAQARGLNLAAAINASQIEFDSYTTDKMLGPADNTIVKVSGQDQLFVFMNNIRHPASSFVISQRGLNPGTAITITQQEAAMFEPGSQLTPKVGSVLRGQTDHAVYLVADDGNLQAYTAFTFAQHSASKRMQIIPDSELASYPKKGFVPPLDGTVIKSDKDNTVYVIEKGIRQGLTAELFRNRGYSFKNIAVLPDDLVNALAKGTFATPKNLTWYAIEKSGAYFYFKDGQAHAISAFVANQRKISPDYFFDAGVAAGWTIGSPLTPRDNTLVKGDTSGTVYVVLSGQLRGLTANAFKVRKYSYKNIMTLPQAEVDSYAKGDVLEK